MTSHSSYYFETFIEVAEDCPIYKAEIPLAKTGKPALEDLNHLKALRSSHA